MNTDLMKTIERVVRPLPCDKTRKNRMRVDLYVQLERIFEEELSRDGKETLALARARNRFGEPDELKRELSAAIPRMHQWQTTLDHFITGRREGCSTLQFATVFAMRAAMTLMLFFAVMIAWGTFVWYDPIILRMWSVFFSIALLFGANCFSHIFLGEWALGAFIGDSDHIYLKKPLRLIATSVGAGLSVAASLFVLLKTSSPGAYWTAIPEMILLPLGLTMFLFLVVVVLMAKVELEDRRWSQLALD